MTIKIDIIRFFETKLVERGEDDWVECESNYAVDAGGANEAQAATIIRSELARRGGSGRPEIAPLPSSGKADSSHESLDLVEPESVDGIAYVIQLPPRTHTKRAAGPGILHPETDLKFCEPPYEPTRIHPKVKSEFRVLPTFVDDKTAWFVIDRTTLKKSDVGKAVAALGLDQAVVPVALNVYESTLGVSAGVLPRKKAQMPAALAPKFWHGGPHPPTIVSITVPLG